MLKHFVNDAQIDGLIKNAIGEYNKNKIIQHYLDMEQAKESDCELVQITDSILWGKHVFENAGRALADHEAHYIINKLLDVIVSETVDSKVFSAKTLLEQIRQVSKDEFWVMLPAQQPCLSLLISRWLAQLGLSHCCDVRAYNTKKLNKHIIIVGKGFAVWKHVLFENRERVEFRTKHTKRGEKNICIRSLVKLSNIRKNKIKILKIPYYPFPQLDTAYILRNYQRNKYDN